ncbi:MAG TPA: glycosyltransferase [Gemmatimonadaceae bacterium]|nr:glycosyltransferase [Gemmatimonadaceae bacterium]
MRVAHIITGLTTGGAERSLYRMLASTVVRGLGAVVISMLDKGTLGPAIEDLGVPVYELGMKRGFPTPGAARRLAQILRSSRVDVVQGWMYHANVAATVVAKLARLKAPVVWNVRDALDDFASEHRSTRRMIALSALLSHSPERIVYNSQASAGRHAAHGFATEKAVVIGNGFDVARFTPNDIARRRVRGELGIGGDAPVVSLVGRDDPVKDHAGFLRAAALVARDVPNVTFVMAGRGVDAENDRLTTLVADLALRDRVRLLGDRRDVAAIMAATDVMVSSSWTEAFPNIVGEAMACGVPCVVTDVGDSSWIVGATGRVVPPRNPEALGAAVRGVLALQPAERKQLGLAARQRVEREFSLGAVAHRYEDLYRTLT